MDKKLSYTFLVLALLFCTDLFGQAKKPTLMVVPSDVWCNENGYMMEFNNQGTTELVPDYKKAMQTSKNLNHAISKINILMAERGFPLKDLQQTVKNIQTISAENQLISSKTSGSLLKENPIDRLRRVAKADILLELDWMVNVVGPKRSISYNLRGLDAYSNKQIAGVQGTGAPSFSAEIPVLIEEAILNNMDSFTEQLQNHFNDLFTNGREVVIDINVFDNGSDIDLESEFDGYELSEIIENWMAQNTVSHRFSKADATETYINFEQVRIPLYKQNGMSQDTEGFTRELMRFLRKAPYNITSKVINRGLGRCLLVIGEK